MNSLVVFEKTESPLELFLLGKRQQMMEILIKHPSIENFGYVYTQKLTKTFLQKKIIDFKKKNNRIVAISGFYSSYIYFSILETERVTSSLFEQKASSTQNLNREVLAPLSAKRVSRIRSS